MKHLFLKCLALPQQLLPELARVTIITPGTSVLTHDLILASCSAAWEPAGGKRVGKGGEGLPGRWR